jgi:hypothetical protein
VVTWLLKASVPVNVPGGNPVMDEPPVPRSPFIIVGPVFVTLERLRTPKDAAVPRVSCKDQRKESSEGNSENHTFADVKVAKESTDKSKSIVAS